MRKPLQELRADLELGHPVPVKAWNVRRSGDAMAIASPTQVPAVPEDGPQAWRLCVELFRLPCGGRFDG